MLLQKIRLMNPGGAVEWFDCEALERRHGLGRGTLLVFDYIQAGHDTFTAAVPPK